MAQLNWSNKENFDLKIDDETTWEDLLIAANYLLVNIATGIKLDKTIDDDFRRQLWREIKNNEIKVLNGIEKDLLMM